MKNESCYLCGSTTNLTNDHIPPKNLFPSPRPSNLITVRCCLECNHSFSLDDEVMRGFLSWGSDSEAGKQIFEEKFLGSTLTRSPKLTENIKNHVINAVHDNGEVSKFVGFPKERGEKYLIRIAKGLTRNFFPNFDYSNYNFRVFRYPRGPVPEDVQPLIPRLLAESRGGGIFRFWRGVAKEDPHYGIWVFRFYDGDWFVVLSYPPSSPLDTKIEESAHMKWHAALDAIFS